MSTPTKRKRDQHAKRHPWSNAMRDALSPAQRSLAKKHGTPAEFARAAYATVPEFCSMDEAAIASAKYNKEWDAAGHHPLIKTAPLNKRLLPEPFNDNDCRRWNAFTKFRSSGEGRRLSSIAKPKAIYAYFMAGYRAGKGAK